MLTAFRLKSLFRPRFLFAAMLLGFLLLSSCTGGGSVPKGWSGTIVDNNNLFLGSMDGRIVSVNTTDGTLLWSVPLQAQATGGGSFGCAPAVTPVAIYGTPAVDNGIVFVAGYNNGKVYRINSVTRDSKDTYARKDAKASPKPIVGGVAVAGGKIYVGSSDGQAYAMDAVSLDLKWQFTTGDKIWSTPTVSGNTVYVASFDRKVYALNADTGSKIWEYKTDGAIVSQPVIDGGTLYVGALDRYFYALNAADGSVKWKYQGGKWFWSKPIVHNGVVYAANLDGSEYALDASTGQKRAEFKLGGPSSASPVIIGDTLIVASEDGKVYSLDTTNNEQKLLLELGDKVFASMAANGNKVYIHSNSDKLFEIDAFSGAKREINIK